MAPIITSAKAATVTAKAKAAARPKRAYVTFLAGNGDYVMGVVGLAKGLRKVKSKYPLVVAILPDVPEDHRKILVEQGCIVKEIEPVYPPENQTQFAMAYYVINYSKLRIWEFVEYSKMIYLDGDIQVFENIDHLFDMEDGYFHAVMDCFCEKTWSHTPQYKIGYCQQCPDKVHWPSQLGPKPPLYFNAGMFVYEPSLSVYKNLLSTLKVTPPAPFAEQDLLNLFFRDIYRPLPTIYNLCMAMLWLHPEITELENAKVVHYCAAGSKPWKFTGEEDNMDRQDIKTLVAKWRDIYNDESLDYKNVMASNEAETDEDEQTGLTPFLAALSGAGVHRVSAPSAPNIASAKAATVTAKAKAAAPPKRAYVTFLVGNGDYVMGVVGLAKGLRKVKSKYPLVVAISPDVPEDHRKIVVDQGCRVKKIEPLYPPENQTQFAMACHVMNYSKLRIWEFVEYSKMIYLDGDIQVFENIDHLFDWEDGYFYAVMDCFCDKTWSHTPQYKIGYCQQCPDKVHWPSQLGPKPPLYFNAGMFVYEPSLSVYKNLLSTLKVTPPAPFAEQDLLNLFFRDIYRPLPTIYNLCMAMLWLHPEITELENAKVVHYCAAGSKPWKFTGEEDNMDRQDIKTLVAKWRDIYNDESLDYKNVMASNEAETDEDEQTGLTPFLAALSGAGVHRVSAPSAPNIASAKAATVTAKAKAAAPPKRAYVTFLVGNGDYVMGVVGLAKGLRKVKSKYPLVVAISPDVPEDHRKIVVDQGCRVKKIEPLYPPENQTQFAMACHVMNYSKLRIWEFVEYSKMIYLDGDIQVFENIDHLFDWEDGYFYAVMDCFCDKTWSHTPQYKIGYCQQCPDKVHWPSQLGPKPPLYFNAGMFVYEPSLSVYKNLLSTLKVTPPAPFAEQDLLNLFFRDIYRPLPTIYNLCMAMLWLHPEITELENAKVVHYCIAGSKPWKFTGEEDNMDRQDIKTLVAKWWDIYNDESLDCRNVMASNEAETDEDEQTG